MAGKQPIVMDLPKIDIKYPTFEVITPQTGISVLVQTMTVAQEKILKGSNITNYTLPSLLDQVIFECIVNKKKPYKDYEGFLKTFTPNDRDALLYGVYQVSYEKLDNFTVSCSNPMCPKKEYTVNVPIQDTVELTMYEDEIGILEKEVSLTLPVSKIKVDLKQYTLRDELDFTELLRRNKISLMDNMEVLLYVQKMEVPTSKGPIMYTALLDMKYVLDRLPVKDRHVLIDRIYEEFAKYGIKMELTSTCPACGTENKVYVNIVGELFRMVQ